VGRSLSERWYEEGTRFTALQPLAWVYGAVSGMRRRAYATGLLASGRAGKPVVVVGNLSVGGTGKTPLTLWLAHELAALGLKPGIISRGYGGSAGAQVREVAPGADWREVGDEPLILARRSGCPTVVGRDRLAAARALASRVDVILSDDGLQHLALARDCEIVVVDGARGFGNGRLLPAGPLRESPARALTVDAVVVNGAPRARDVPAGAFGMQLVAQAALRLDAQAEPRALESFRGADVHGVAGIGNPARFFAELRAHGLNVTEHPFPDHHPLTAGELAFGDERPVLMTEKDAVKCTAFADARLWYVPVRAEFPAADARELLTRVLAKVRGTHSTGGS
jgi:tetraacyldisaccharide 4'-kinase